MTGQVAGRCGYCVGLKAGAEVTDKTQVTANAVQRCPCCGQMAFRLYHPANPCVADHPPVQPEDTGPGVR